MAAPRLLLLLGQSAFDPSSGAAQSMRQWAELLAACGWEVAALSTSACESPAAAAAGLGLLAPDGSAGVAAPSAVRAAVRVTTLLHAGVAHEIVHADPLHPRRWESDVGDVYQALLARRAGAWRPDALLCFGDDPGDRARRTFLRAQGGAVRVFALHNLAYRERPAAVDRFVAPSDFVAAHYRRRWSGAAVDALPTALMPQAVLAETHDPVFVTFVNPGPAKGAALVARLAARLGQERPDIPLLVVEGRAPAASLLALARAQGAALDDCPNVMFAPATGDARRIWAGCRVLLMPSIVEEAAGRAALEAMANGAVAVVADRGALPETVGDAGIVLPAGADAADAAPDIVAAWFDAVVALVDDTDAYARRAARCRAHAARHLPAALGTTVDAAFRRWIDPGATGERAAG